MIKSALRSLKTWCISCTKLTTEILEETCHDKQRVNSMVLIETRTVEGSLNFLLLNSRIVQKHLLMCFTTFKYHEFFFVGVIKNCVHVLTRKHVCCNHFRIKNCTISDLAAVKRDETCACAWTCFLTPALR